MTQLRITTSAILVLESKVERVNVLARSSTCPPAFLKAAQEDRSDQVGALTRALGRTQLQSLDVPQFAPPKFHFSTYKSDKGRINFHDEFMVRAKEPSTYTLSSVAVSPVDTVKSEPMDVDISAERTTLPGDGDDVTYLKCDVEINSAAYAPPGVGIRFNLPGTAHGAFRFTFWLDQASQQIVITTEIPGESEPKETRHAFREGYYARAISAFASVHMPTGTLEEITFVVRHRRAAHPAMH